MEPSSSCVGEQNLPPQNMSLCSIILSWLFSKKEQPWEKLWKSSRGYFFIKTFTFTRKMSIFKGVPSTKMVTKSLETLQWRHRLNMHKTSSLLTVLFLPPPTTTLPSTSSSVFGRGWMVFFFTFWPPSGIESSQARDQLWVAAVAYAEAAGNTGSLTYSAGPGIELMSQHLRCAVDPIAKQQELLRTVFSVKALAMLASYSVFQGLSKIFMPLSFCLTFSY